MAILELVWVKVCKTITGWVSIILCDILLNHLHNSSLFQPIDYYMYM